NKELAELKRFQLQLYSDAVESANPGWEPAGALYVSVTSGKRGNGMIRKEYNCKPGGPRADGKNGPKPGERKYFGVGGSSGALLDDEKFEDLR
ncbi:hypothetical protein, partial [Proteus mirabilis]|uniref:hypothetical protein n=1 Tax=Proteus mirabilis TaxID=584 RepID=UPI0039B43D26